MREREQEMSDEPTNGGARARDPVITYQRSRERSEEHGKREGERGVECRETREGEPKASERSPRQFPQFRRKVMVRSARGRHV